MSLYDKTSLALIPSGTKASTLYSVLPANGNGDFDHTRASSATRVNKDGLIESVASNVPRLDYPIVDGVVQDCPALLLEPQRLNISRYSENFTLWSGGLATADQATAPDGNLTADELTKTSAFSAQSRTETGTSGVNYVFSIFVKPKTTNTITLRQASGSNDVRRYFDLENETSGNSGGNQTGFVSEGIEKYPNGWYRVHIVCTSDGTSISTNLYAGRAGNTTYDGEIYIWGSQLEQGDYITSYIPNLSSGTTSRSADSCNGAGTSAEFNDSEGVLFAEIAALANDGSFRFITINDGNYTDRVAIAYTSSDNQIRVQVTVGGSDSYIKLQSITDATEFIKIAIKYKASDFAIWINGTEYQAQSSGSVFPGGTLDNLSFDNGAGGSDFYGKVKQLMVFNEALTDAELESLTS